MPQATPELHKKWGVMPEKAEDYLYQRGYILRPDWTWVAPQGHEPTGEEKSAVLFLIQEWDMGGWIPHEEHVAEQNQ